MDGRSIPDPGFAGDHGEPGATLAAALAAYVAGRGSQVDARPPTLGRGRLLCVDGPAGSGKTTLADEVRAITGAPVVHMDNLSLIHI